MMIWRLGRQQGKEAQYSPYINEPLTQAAQVFYYRNANIICKRREVAIESIISNLLSRFEKGSLSRRELVQGLANTRRQRNGSIRARRHQLQIRNHRSCQCASR